MDPINRSRPYRPPNDAYRRPMAFVRRVSLFRREIHESVSPAALEVLLGSAGRISEGKLSGGRYFGCTMLTLDLGEVQGAVSDPCDVATAARLARRLAAEPYVEQEVRRLALSEARRITSRSLDLVEAELRVRVEGTRVFIDVDLEGALNTSSASAVNGS